MTALEPPYRQTSLTTRIISLLPAATEIVAALGALGQLVGVTHECDFPPEVNGIPRVTTSLVDREASSRAIDENVRALSAGGAPVFALDAGQLRRLAPTLILTQSLCEVCAVSEGDVRSLAAVLDPAPRLLSLGGTTLDGIRADIRAVGDALGRAAEADALLGTIAARMRAVHETLEAARAPRPRVAVIEWLDPVFAAGHWTPELVRRAGGIDVLAEPGTHSVEIATDRIRAAEPELLLFAPCGFDADRAARESAALLRTTEWRWATGIEAWAIDGNALTSRPGPRLADAVEVMAAMFAPGLFPTPPARYARRLAAGVSATGRTAGSPAPDQ
jgi:iron complex transport system substrate-binding protein